MATWLVEHGGCDHLKGPGQARPPAFDPVMGIDTEDLFEFIGATQANAWERFKRLHGGLPGAQSKFVARLAAEIDKRGMLDVLRHGVVDHGVTIRLAYFRPAHGLTPELVRLCSANRLNVTRQLTYQAGSTKTIDLGLFVNGLLVATAEARRRRRREPRRASRVSPPADSGGWRPEERRALQLCVPSNRPARPR